MSGLQRLMASELQLMVGIIPVQHKKKIFEIICRDSLDLVLKEPVFPPFFLYSWYQFSAIFPVLLVSDFLPSCMYSWYQFSRHFSCTLVPFSSHIHCTLGISFPSIFPVLVFRFPAIFLYACSGFSCFVFLPFYLYSWFVFQQFSPYSCFVFPTFFVYSKRQFSRLFLEHEASVSCQFFRTLSFSRHFLYTQSFSFLAFFPEHEASVFRPLSPCSRKLLTCHSSRSFSTSFADTKPGIRIRSVLYRPQIRSCLPKIDRIRILQTIRKPDII